MSDIEKFEQVRDLVSQQETNFNALAKNVAGINFEREQVFAVQALKNNPYLCGIAYKNKDSLKNAIINVAATGLSLNPVRKQAYLVPRDDKVILDISYMGLIQIALDIGAIKWAKADLVYEKDTFHMNGINKEPDHSYSPFEERGEIKGAYCVAKTHDDEYITSVMSIKEIHDIRDRSVSWKAYKSKGRKSPWNTDEGEMIKKTVIRRAYKSWPLTNTKADRFHKALEITDDDHKIVDVNEPTKQEQENNTELLQTIRGQLEFIERKEKDAVEYAATINKRKIEKLEDMSKLELEKFHVLLKGFVDKKLVADQESQQEEEQVDENKDTDKKPIKDV